MECSTLSPPSMRVLVIEGDGALRGLAVAALEAGGHEVTDVGTCAAAIGALARLPDIVILDRVLPDGDGADFIPSIRSARPQAHVMLINGLAEESERVAGLVAGADDYLIAPLSIRELFARVAAVAQRLVRQRSGVLHLGALSIDAHRRVARVHGRPLDLTRREFDLLYHLAANRDRAISRAELLAVAWASSAEWQTPATVTEHVRRLRAKLEADPTSPRWIVSVRGVGYRLDVPTSNDDESKDLAVVIVKGSTILHATPSVARLVGAASVSEVVGRTVSDFIAPASVAAFDHRRSGEAGAATRPEIITLVRSDGSDVHVEIGAVASTGMANDAIRSRCGRSMAARTACVPSSPESGPMSPKP